MYLFIILKNYIVFLYIVAQFSITNGPMDTTVCDGNTVNISCGIDNSLFGFLVPNWRIRFISNMIIAGDDIINNDDDGLEWIPDDNNITENDRLLVGPVNETYNQSTFQCIYSGVAASTIGTLTVAGEIFHYVCICVFIV